MFAPHPKTTDTTFLFEHHLEAVIDLCLDKFFAIVQVRVFTGTMDTFPRVYALPGSGSTGLCGSSSAACLGGPILTLSAAAASAASAATASAAAATAATTAAAITITRNIHTSTVTVAAVSAASVGRPHLMRSATLAAAAALTFPRPRARSGL
jgi:hypothetical protein